MDKRYNFQINPIQNRRDWDKIPLVTVWWPGWESAMKYADMLATQHCAVVRVTEGDNPQDSIAVFVRWEDAPDRKTVFGLQDFRFTLKHDDGKACLLVTTSGGIKGAIDQVTKAELCPETAILSIRRIGKMRN